MLGDGGDAGDAPAGGQSIQRVLWAWTWPVIIERRCRSVGPRAAICRPLGRRNTNNRRQAEHQFKSMRRKRHRCRLVIHGWPCRLRVSYRLPANTWHSFIFVPLDDIFQISFSHYHFKFEGDRAAIFRPFGSIEPALSTKAATIPSNPPDDDATGKSVAIKRAPSQHSIQWLIHISSDQLFNALNQ